MNNNSFEQIIDKNNVTLFPGEGGQFYACLNYMKDMDYCYVRGYLTAAQILVSYVEKEQMDQDGLVYPIIFCYRQCIELKLKKILRDFSDLNDEEFEIKINAHHDIIKLWRKAFIAFLSVEKKYDIQDVQEIVKKIHEIDPNSFSFRYSTDKVGNKSIEHKIQRIHIISFSEHAEKVIEFLDFVIFQIREKINLKEELEESI